MKFLVPNYSCLQNPWLRGYRPQIPVLSVLCPQPNLLNPSRKKIPGYATGENGRITPFLTSTLDVAEWSALFVALFRPSDSEGSHWVEGCLQLSQSGLCGKESRLLPETEPWRPRRPSHTLITILAELHRLSSVYTISVKNNSHTPGLLLSIVIDRQCLSSIAIDCYRLETISVV